MDWRGLLDWLGFFVPVLLWTGLSAVVWLRTGRNDQDFIERLSEVDPRYGDPDGLSYAPDIPPNALQRSFLLLGAVVHRQPDPTLERLRAPVRRDLALRAGAVMLGWIPAMAVDALLRNLL